MVVGLLRRDCAYALVGGVGHAPGRPAAGYTSALNRRSEGFPQSPLAFIPR